MSEATTESLSDRIYSRFLDELESESSLGPEDRDAIGQAVRSGTIGTEAVVRPMIEAMGARDGKNNGS